MSISLSTKFLHSGSGILPKTGWAMRPRLGKKVSPRRVLEGKYAVSVRGFEGLEDKYLNEVVYLGKLLANSGSNLFREVCFEEGGEGKRVADIELPSGFCTGGYKGKLTLYPRYLSLNSAARLFVLVHELSHQVVTLHDKAIKWGVGDSYYGNLFKSDNFSKGTNY